MEGVAVMADRDGRAAMRGATPHVCQTQRVISTLLAVDVVVEPSGAMGVEGEGGSACGTPHRDQGRGPRFELGCQPT